MKNVIILDKQDITRVGIQALIEDMAKISSLLLSETKSDLIRSLAIHPDAVVILDYTLSDFGSVDELLNVGYRFPEARWILFSDELSYDFLRRLIMNSQAYSIVLKSSELSEINMGLVHVFRGERFICARVTNLLLQAQKPAADSLDHLLTATEKEILKELALGRTTKEIAAHRNLSFHTIITHRKNIFRKLEVNNIHEAIKYAMRAGLIDLAEYYI